MEKGRKTNVPIKSIPDIVEWLLENCTRDELSFMARIATDRKDFAMLRSILTRLTEQNVYEVFYSRFSGPRELELFHSAKRGEVAGLKAFSMACQAASEELKRRKNKK